MPFCEREYAPNFASNCVDIWGVLLILCELLREARGSARGQGAFLLFVENQIIKKP